MNAWITAELDFAAQLRSADRNGRVLLYEKAYETVSRLRWDELAVIENPAARTAGTNPLLAASIARICKNTDKVIEFGCGRGYTAMVVAPKVAHYLATDVSTHSLNETRTLLAQHELTMAEVAYCSAIAPLASFDRGEFNMAIAIDVIEHLHPDDAMQHYHEVFHLLAKDGTYIVCSPNALTGPHDITRTIYPDARTPLGFHLNECSCRALIADLRRAGFRRFFSFDEQRSPHSVFLLQNLEILYQTLQGLRIHVSSLAERITSIKILAIK